jgi:hypothetical protein
MLRFVGFSVLELQEGLEDILKRGDVDPMAIVVPIHVHTKVAHSFPVDQACVVFVEIFYRMVGMLPSHILEVIDTEHERNGLPIVFPKAWCDLAFLVSM